MKSRLVMFAADYCAGEPLLSRQRDAVEVSQFRLIAGKQICPRSSAVDCYDQCRQQKLAASVSIRPCPRLWAENHQMPFVLLYLDRDEAAA